MMKNRITGNSTIVSNTLKAQSKIREIENDGLAAQGRSESIDNLKGKRLYASKAIRAYCYDCMSYYADGKGDCGDPLCPLYPFMPYRYKHHPAGQLEPLPAKNEHAPDRLDTPKTGSTTKGAGA